MMIGPSVHTEHSDGPFYLFRLLLLQEGISADTTISDEKVSNESGQRSSVIGHIIPDRSSQG